MAKITCKVGDTLKCLSNGWNYTQHKDWKYGISKVTYEDDEFEVQEISGEWIKSIDGRIVYNRNNYYVVVKTNSDYEIY